MRIDRNEAIFVTLFTSTIIIIGIVVAFQLMQPLGYAVESSTQIPSTAHAEGTLLFTGNVSSGELVNISAYTFEFTNNGSVASGHIPVNISANQPDNSTDTTTAITNLTAAIQNNASVASLVTASAS